MTENVKHDKWALWSPIIAVIVSIIISAMISNFNRARDAVTHDVAVEMIDSKGEEILDRANKYTDIKVEGQSQAYKESFSHIESLLEKNNEMNQTVFFGIKERLDRIDKRISELGE